MSIEGASYGAGGGVIGVVLSYLGFKQRLDRMQVEIDNKVSYPTFTATIDALKEHHQSIDQKLNVIIEHVVRK